jgi:putative phosphoribosyl transferase
LLKQPSRFANLRTAGRELAPSLVADQNDPNAIVLGIASGGTPVALEVAHFLNLPCDLILIRRLLIGPDGSHLCAINIAGETILDDGISVPATPATPLDHFLTEAVSSFNDRAKLCRGGRAPISLAHRKVIVVDCGIRSGSTMLAAIRALRRTEARRIIAAVPVSSMEGRAEVAPLFDEFICLMEPEQFVNAGFWYVDFGRPRDEEVGVLLG